VQISNIKKTLKNMCTIFKVENFCIIFSWVESRISYKEFLFCYFFFFIKQKAEVVSVMQEISANSLILMQNSIIVDIEAFLPLDSAMVCILI